MTRATVVEKSSTDFQDYICISFDGRKDKTFIQEDDRRRLTVEEHITILKEPGSKYLGHISLKSGNAKNIAAKLFNFFVNNSISLTKIVAVGCDGTATNTGVKAGIHQIA